MGQLHTLDIATLLFLGLYKYIAFYCKLLWCILTCHNCWCIVRCYTAREYHRQTFLWRNRFVLLEILLDRPTSCPQVLHMHNPIDQVCNVVVNAKAPRLDAKFHVCISNKVSLAIG